MNAGDVCPLGRGGKLYQSPTGVMVRIKGQNLAEVHKYWAEKLRCALCGYLIAAKPPTGAGLLSGAGLAKNGAKLPLASTN